MIPRRCICTFLAPFLLIALGARAALDADLQAKANAALAASDVAALRALTPADPGEAVALGGLLVAAVGREKDPVAAVALAEVAADLADDLVATRPVEATRIAVALVRRLFANPEPEQRAALESLAARLREILRSSAAAGVEEQGALPIGAVNQALELLAVAMGDDSPPTSRFSPRDGSIGTTAPQPLDPTVISRSN